MRERDPREVAEVSALARRDEAHGDRVVRGVLCALMTVAPALVLEVIHGACKPAAALAHEPTREFQRPHPDARKRVAHVALGRLAKVVALGEVEIRMQRFEARDE